MENMDNNNELNNDSINNESSNDISVNNNENAIEKINRSKEAEENKKYIFKVAVVACAIVFVLLVGAGLLVGLFLFIKGKSDMEKMVGNYEIYSEEIYKKKYGDRIVKEMVNNYSADVNETDNNNQSPLFHAVQNNNMKAVEFLIENKADAEIADDSGVTPLILAISNNNTKIAEFLIKEGKANVYGSYTGNNFNRYPMYYAVSQTNKTMIKLLLDNSFDLKREPLLLSYAIDNSDESIVRYLIDNGADINYKSADGTTVLYNAVLSLNPALVDYFISKGAKIEEAGESDVYGNIIMAAAGSKFNNTSSSPVDLVLMQQKSADSAKVMEKIITNINKNTLNRLVNGKNALIIAVGNSYIDTVKVLLTNGADVNFADNDGWTSLMYAANNGDIELAKLLIENKANVNAKSYEEKTPLLYAMNSPIESSRNDMINLLIENKANINVEDSNGLSPLTVAVMNNDTELTKLLIANKANLSVVTKDGESLIEYAINNDNVDLLQILVEAGADINYAGISSYTPLMIAAKSGAENIARILLSQKVDLNAVDKYGDTALHIAAENSKLPIVRMILEKKPNLNIQNQNGDTPLHKAVNSGSVDIVSEIVLSGADVMVRNNNGDYPLDIAKDNNNNAIFEILKEAEEKQQSN
ncbi:ankyrin repeat domain-containing protein [Brachyspira alvinipulli]|uniref:ankyrin repeat domain-containing protein n=1 Tax=Brachyspira alvinipulli TaxID=84379 RepID=UPI0004850B38|nr:ankyrin repeat domain-containing protein [Brachyspira alvinipulli]